MCAGCCRYLPDHHIAKIPIIGRFLIEKSNAEKGGWIYKLFARIYQKEIRECEKGFEEAYQESIKPKIPDTGPGSESER